MSQTPKSCRGCFYRQKTGSITTCDYCYITGESRGCSVEECTHYMLAPKGKAFRKEKLEKRLLNV